MDMHDLTRGQIRLSRPGRCKCPPLVTSQAPWKETGSPPVAPDLPQPSGQQGRSTQEPTIQSLKGVGEGESALWPASADHPSHGLSKACKSLRSNQRPTLGSSSPGVGVGEWDRPAGFRGSCLVSQVSLFAVLEKLASILIFIALLINGGARQHTSPPVLSLGRSVI